MMNHHILNKRNVYCSDTLAYLIAERLHLSPITTGLFSIPFVTVLYLFTALVSNTLWSTLEQVGLLQDWIPWIATILINPVVLGYYLWSFQAINNVIQNLIESDIVEIDELEIEKIVTAIYFEKWRNILALVSAIGFSIFVFVTQTRLDKSWTGSGLLPNLSVTLATFIVVYAGSKLVLNQISNIQILHRILRRKQLNLNPLHPDRCGGLRPLSNYSIKTAYLVAILGAWVGIVGYQIITQGSRQDYWYVGLIVVLYVSISVACFFGPLLTAHRGMQKAKESLLHDISQQFLVDYLQIRNNLKEDAETLKKRTEKIIELRAFYTITDEFPVWPFDIQTFRRYLLTIPTPLIAPLIGLLQKFYEVLLK